MDDTRISQLTFGEPLSGGEFIPSVQYTPAVSALQTVYTTPADIADYILGEFVDSLYPTGVVVPYAGELSAKDLPKGWLMCDGSSALSADHPQLFNTIRYTYGGGNGVFYLPDLRERVIVGHCDTNLNTNYNDVESSWSKTQNSKLGSSGGARSKILTLQETPLQNTVIDVVGEPVVAPKQLGGASIAEYSSPTYSDTSSRIVTSSTLPDTWEMRTVVQRIHISMHVPSKAISRVYFALQGDKMVINHDFGDISPKILVNFCETIPGVPASDYYVSSDTSDIDIYSAKLLGNDASKISSAGGAELGLKIPPATVYINSVFKKVTKKSREKSRVFPKSDHVTYQLMNQLLFTPNIDFKVTRVYVSPKSKDTDQQESTKGKSASLRETLKDRQAFDAESALYYKGRLIQSPTSENLYKTIFSINEKTDGSFGSGSFVATISLTGVKPVSISHNNTWPHIVPKSRKNSYTKVYEESDIAIKDDPYYIQWPNYKDFGHIGVRNGTERKKKDDGSLSYFKGSIPLATSRNTELLYSYTGVGKEIIVDFKRLLPSTSKIQHKNRIHVSGAWWSAEQIRRDGSVAIETKSKVEWSGEKKSPASLTNFTQLVPGFVNYANHGSFYPRDNGGEVERYYNSKCNYTLTPDINGDIIWKFTPSRDRNIFDDPIPFPPSVLYELNIYLRTEPNIATKYAKIDYMSKGQEYLPWRYVSRRDVRESGKIASSSWQYWDYSTTIKPKAVTLDAQAGAQGIDTVDTVVVDESIDTTYASSTNIMSVTAARAVTDAVYIPQTTRPGSLVVAMSADMFDVGLNVTQPHTMMNYIIKK